MPQRGVGEAFNEESGWGPSAPRLPVRPMTTADPNQVTGILNQVRPTSGAHYPSQGVPTTPSTDLADSIVRALGSFLRDTGLTVGQPGHNAPHWYSTPIDQSARYVLQAAADPVGTYHTVLSYTVPPGRRARITGYGVNVLDGTFTYDGSIVWRIIVNGVGKYADLLDWTIQRGSIVQPLATVMNEEESTIIAFQVRRAVAAVGTTSIDHCLVGYTWQPRKMLDGARASILYTG